MRIPQVAQTSKFSFDLKGVRDSLFWSHSELLRPRNTDLDYPKFHVPTRKEFHEVLYSFTEQ